ncbi:hypothetical protein CMV_026250 [Castanea mollissima]|uniref:Uncharacterized protein n=1 Tax=Castanea mollissima TaxID=60419 RepID=A0A8J4QC49_9ROSI|nr:hypothetical protein CMV_026250 [Castanea mollissima]
MPTPLRFFPPKVSPKILIGEITELSPKSKIRVHADHAGVSVQLGPWKVLTTLPPGISLASASNNLWIVIMRFRQVELALELIFEAVRALLRIVVLFQQLIRDLHQIISMAHDGFQQDVSVLQLIDDVVRSLFSLVDQLQQLIHTCRGIWSIWTARQLAAVANEHQNEVPPTNTEADAANGQNDVMMSEELNI